MIVTSTAPVCTEFTEHDDIIDVLDRHRVPYKRWGTETPFSLERFVRSLEEEQVALKETEGKLFLDVRSVKVVIQHYLPNGKFIELYESHRNWRHHGGIRIERNFRGIAKTLKRNESCPLAAHRALADEPGFSEPGFKSPENYKLIGLTREQGDIQKSHKWLGLDAVHLWDVFRCTIDGKLYGPGYKQILWDVVTYYEWREV